MPAPHCRFALDTTTSPDVLLRVLTLLRRRGCDIVAVEYLREDRHGPGRFEVGVEAPVRVAHRLREWLGGLVDVLAVREG